MGYLIYLRKLVKARELRSVIEMTQEGKYYYNYWRVERLAGVETVIIDDKGNITYSTGLNSNSECSLTC